MSNMYNQISLPSSQRANSPNINMRSSFDVDGQYLTELLAERQKLGPFMQVLPLCTRLLNQEISRVTGKNELVQNQGFSDFDRMRFINPSHMASPNSTSTFTGWNSLSHERLASMQGLNMDWQTSPVVPSSPIVKKILRLDIPKDSYPNFNFVGRLLGPRGNSLKRVEATTGCRVFIRGKGSIKDLDKEELLRGRPGYEHLNDPLHILIEAELPASVVDVRLRQAQEIIQELLKPVDESHDIYKRQQLRELAMLNSNFREESPQLSGSVSPFTSNEIKRVKTDQ
ncbi:hypothetical protein PHAVU_006G080900 [Phaseolus vulgaris]|uniref:KH domain-containing protein At3g08620-like isoform X2 n=1 Tax=Phaseolus vulgaris TaxID=3885 RepID=UPI0035CC7E47